MIFKTVLLVIVSWIYTSDSIYQFQVPTIEGNNQQLSAYEGKKILIVTLPINQDSSSDSLLFSLDTLATAHLTDLKVIATPSYEDGFTVEERDALKTWYR